MKILIISIPRSGSTSLFNALVYSSEEIKFNSYFEPWNPDIHKYTGKNIDFDGDCIVKTITHQKPVGSYWKYFYTKLISKFDKVILLSRKNKNAVIESLSYAKEASKINLMFDWHTKYNFKDIKDLPLEKSAREINFNYERLDNLKALFNLNVYFYEDLYTNSDVGRKKLLEELDIEVNMEKFNTFFDLKNKYRQ